MSNNQTTESESITSILKKILGKQHYKLTEAIIFHKLKNSWPKIAAGDLQKFTEVIDYQNYVIFIGVKNSVWAQQLMFYKNDIIQKYKEIYPKIVIKDLKTKNVEISPVEIYLPEKKLTPEEIEENQKKLIDIEIGENIKNKLESLINKSTIISKNDSRETCAICGNKFNKKNDNDIENICIRCQNNQDYQEYSLVLRYINEAPWGRYQDIKQDLNFINEEKYHKIKEREIKNIYDVLKRAQYLKGKQLSNNDKNKLKNKLIKYIMLKGGITPDKVTEEIIKKTMGGLGEKLYKKLV